MSEAFHLPSSEPDDSWKARGACIGARTDVFYDEDGPSPKQAKQLCGRCAVAVECLRFALLTNEEHGIWGGMTPRERKFARLPKRSLWKV